MVYNGLTKKAVSILLSRFKFCQSCVLFRSSLFLHPDGGDTVPSAVQKPGLIRDTDVADGVETAPEIKGPDPLLCEKNIKIGDFYYKKKNYVAAIRRYLDAIEYQTNSVRAYECACPGL